MDVPAPPDSSRQAFGLLFALENGLRELIIDELSRLAGPLWYKSRLPGDVMAKYKDGVAFERRITWVQLVPHHPMYYLDFPDLRKVIERKDNWRDVFASIFGRPELVASLGDLDLIRNKVAHGRKITQRDLQILTGTLAKLATAVGGERFIALAARVTIREDIGEQLERIKEEMVRAHESCQRCAPYDLPEGWTNISRQWWFDEDYLLLPIERVRVFFTAVGEYARLPRVRGQGHRIEDWLHKTGFQELFAGAMAQVDALLSERLSR